MAKKSKNPLKNGDSNDVAKPNEGSNSSTVFKTLFGEVPEQEPAANSLFSDNNPFRRKFLEIRRPNEELGLGLSEKENKHAEFEANLGDSETSESKKSKGNDKKSISNLGSESEETVKTDSGGNGENGGGVKNEKIKKKRKRDEVETEYEARRYGTADEMKENNVESNVVGEKRKKMDNPEEMMVPKEGFDDENKLLRTVFVGNLPLKLKKKEIAKEFGKFGEVESVRIRSVPIVDGKIPRKGAVIKKQINESGDSVHAYVVFKTEESAQASLAYNMAVVGGNHIRVDRACPPRKKLKGENPLLYDNKRTVFLGNLPFDVRDEEIYQLFASIKNLETSVEAVRVIRDSGSSLGKGIAYVLFKTMDAANMTVKRRNLRLRDRELRLSHAKPADTSLKTMNTSQPQSNSAKKVAGGSRTRESAYKENAKANISYQGLHASKSGGQKKVLTKINNFSARSKSQPAMERHSSGKKKRPSVAARKEKVLRAAANASKVTGTKRKLGNPSSDSGGLKKKARKFR
ncbi:RNA-binding family protein [Perilla frutescens var. frutescens]|nr:RNA-binding family protein [Perilla frutescens var. frutescens]